MLFNNTPELTTAQQVETSFIREFINYLDVVRQLCSVEGSTVKSVCQKLFGSHTKPLFQKWCKKEEIKHFLVWRSKYATDFSSFGVSYKGNLMLIPHKLVSDILISQTKNLVQSQKIINLDTLFSLLWKSFSEKNLSLNVSDIKLINFYTSSDFIQSQKRFPSQEEVANFISCNPRTVSTRGARLYDDYILSHTYLIDVTKLGYQTFAVIFNDEQRKLLQPLDNFCLGMLPIEFGLTRGGLKVFQVPYWKHQIFASITECLDPLFEFNLTNALFSYNLSQLYPTPSMRWEYLPPVLTGLDWNEEDIILEKIGISSNLIPDISNPLKITSSHARLLSFYYEHGTAQDIQLAEYTGLNQHSINRIWQEILAYKLVFPYTDVMNVGLDLPLWVMLVGKRKEDHSILLPQIVDHLRYFPSTRIFYSFGNEDERALLIGLMRIPSFWYEDFAVSWAQLSDYDLIPFVGVMTQNFHLKRNINLSNTFF